MLFKPLLAGTLSGKIGAIVASHGRGGAYFRILSIGTDPKTPQQVIMRTLLGNLAAAWQTITAPQREGWETYGVNVPTTNRIGETIFLTGQQWFVKCNAARQQAGLARVDKPPIVFSLATLSLVSALVFATGNGYTLSFNALDEWATVDDGALLVYGSRQKAPTVKFFNGPYRLAGSILGNTALPPTSPDASIVSPFELDPGNFAFLRFVAVQQDGRISAEQFLGQSIIGA